MAGGEEAQTYECSVSTSDAMRVLAATLAPHLQPGDVVLLIGGLGAGKTCFVKGVARALGITDELTSPTFTIHVAYEGPTLTLNHFDLYRLTEASELDDIGYWDLIEDEGVSFVEWGDTFPRDTPDDYLELTITMQNDQVRQVRVCAYGLRAQRLLQAWSKDTACDWHTVA